MRKQANERAEEKMLQKHNGCILLRLTMLYQQYQVTGIQKSVHTRYQQNKTKKPKQRKRLHERTNRKDENEGKNQGTKKTFSKNV